MTRLHRLPAVQPLSKILPSGTEGGKEFSRIIGLLLFNDERINDIHFNLFDDSSGDYEGLDSYSSKSKSKEVIGYQYKFFSSPFTDSHRQQIKLSIENSIARSKNLTLKKWVLVTPDDLKNAALRKEGGDVVWFDNLREKYKDIFEIEHLGHSKLQSLFMQTQYLCLFYYPELIPSGISRRKSINELRIQYDENMSRKYGKIEFVGMSIYKEEASQRIPLENIYIPLSVVSERETDENEDTPRISPTKFLIPGSKTVILGDPGSGKSTMMAFLALVGKNKALQSRCNFAEDIRLPIFITLRRYADELKSRKNLPLLDYILEVAIADFTMNSLEKSFYEYYIESGQAIVLFDGLDELPSGDFKITIKQRIDSFAKNYPENTIIITSRLIGYDGEMRFDAQYDHFRMAKLKESEIEKFILDWYTIRTNDTDERNRNSSDLIRVIKHQDNESIRALATNPLLLTIVALVHRIDAVLPDQRVVLYQKCTETLLNTWYKAKRRDEEIVKGRIERRNRLRVEAIAYWMHKESLGNEGRSVAPKEEILNFLKNYILTNEKIRENEVPAEDQAEIFLDFIKNSAGLLIEVGDELYSFIHLTFQEYLCATYLSTFGEIGGTQTIWDELEGDLQNPRWREVVRLLVASLKSTSAQNFFIEKILIKQKELASKDSTLLLIGLLRDAIEPAEDKSREIIQQSIETLQLLNEENDIRVIERALLNWTSKTQENLNTTTSVFDEIFSKANSEKKITLALIRPTIGIGQFSNEQKITISKIKGHTNEVNLLRSFVFSPAEKTKRKKQNEKVNLLSLNWALIRPESNAASAIIFCSSNLLDDIDVAKKLLTREIALLCIAAHGPHYDNGLNLASIAYADTEIHSALKKSLKNSLSNKRKTKRRSTNKELSKLFENFITLNHPECLIGNENNNYNLSDIISEELERRTNEIEIPYEIAHMARISHDKDEIAELESIREIFLQKINTNPAMYWQMLQSSKIFSSLFISGIQNSFDIINISHWNEALSETLTKSIPETISYFFNHTEWDAVIKRLEEKSEDIKDIYFSAWLILFDVWIWLTDGYKDEKESPIYRLLTLSREINHPIIIFALQMRLSLINKKHLEIINSIYIETSQDLNEILTSAGWPLTKNSFDKIQKKIRV
ncbi:NACHT domain-containing NTPase [Janthinobacterium sp. SUN137]|uniref:NACHT domain-containing protein n=1 Tax=Janthinobacterium sp. SUN137 TaxID=3014789 RepID=UPI0027142CFD|nr:NACHT domain-containing protein [Janthinobacterium sp. SUN137]MDO8040043.1 NACHT domain-containing protein [Janthinobacterium sp. SUN137]